MPEQTVEARIRDLERRLDLDPGSRLFVSLAEEYRKVGRVRDALSALQKGLLAHPGYVAAQVALGRVYVEANQNTDAIATFTKVLASDPGNLVAAKSLADIFYTRGDNLEALKKFKLYRALSGDRKVDSIIAKIEPQVAPKPITPLKKILSPEMPQAPPPPSFQDTDKGRRRPTASRLPVPPPELSDPFDVTSLAFEPGDDSGKGGVNDGPFSAIPTRDTFIAPPSARSAPAPVQDAAPAEAPRPEFSVAEPAPMAEVMSAEAAEPAAVPDAPPHSAAPADDMEETQSARAPREHEETAEPSREAASPREHFSLDSGERAEPELPEPPALFIAPAASAEAGEVRLPPAPRVPAVSLEPREFPPPYAEPASATSEPSTEADGDDTAAVRFEPAALELPAPDAGVPSEAEPAAPTGRALADLYYAQGHYAEALQIYDDLVTRHPFDDDLKRMRRDAEARLLPAASTPSVASQDPSLERRLSRVRVLKKWLGQIQGSPPAAPGP